MSTTTSAALPPSAAESGRTAEMSVLRLNILRCIYALIGIGEGCQVIPGLFNHEPTARGVIPSLLAAMCLLDLVGIRYPRQMLPLLIFELTWKAIWIAFFGLAQWSSGQAPPTFTDDFTPILGGLILMPLILPWGYIWRQYVIAPGDRWRATKG